MGFDTLDQTFWERVEVKGPDECWLWQGALCHGYGQLYLPCGSARKKKLVKAHRASFVLANQRYPKGVVRHMCHNKRCVNPAHLQEGTQAENVRDTVEAGNQHHPIGTLNGRAKLTEDAVREIRSLLPFRYGDVSAASRKYGVSRVVISSIRAGRLWPHVR